MSKVKYLKQIELEVEKTLNHGYSFQTSIIFNYNVLKEKFTYAMWNKLI